MAVQLNDPKIEHSDPEKLDSSDGEKWSEMWDGVYVMPTLPNDEHQEIQAHLVFALMSVGLGKVRAGVNVADRHPDWKYNFRGPDVVVYLAGNPAVNHGSHWVGGPDLAVEIVSPDEDPRAKIDFYAAVNTRAVLVIDRDPWALELYHLAGGRLVPAGRSDAATPAVLASGVLPLTFQLRDGTPRPTILVTHTATGQTWTV